MSMYSDITWVEKVNTERSEYNSKTITDHARNFPRGRRSFLGTWIRKEMVRKLTLIKPTDPGKHCRTNDGEFLRIRSPDISCLQCL